MLCTMNPLVGLPNTSATLDTYVTVPTKLLKLYTKERENNLENKYDKYFLMVEYISPQIDSHKVYISIKVNPLDEHLLVVIRKG